MPGNWLVGWKQWLAILNIRSGMALLILIIASINFINIALARSLRRGKEVGIRQSSWL